MKEVGFHQVMHYQGKIQIYVGLTAVEVQGNLFYTHQMKVQNSNIKVVGLIFQLMKY